MTSVEPWDEKTWNNLAAGGTAATVERGPRRWEKGFAYDRNLLADLAARLDAAEAAAGNVVGAYRRGQTADAGPPALDAPMFVNEQTSELWIPRGTGWSKVALTAVAGTVSGGSNAPTNFTAEVKPGNTIDLAWTLPTPPSGHTISAVTVREKFVSPGGVSGMPLAGTATSNTRPSSSSTATREYYVTCTFTPTGGGATVESAESNHVTVYLPYGSAPTGGGGGSSGGTTGGGSASSPAALLGLGALPKVGGRYNLGVGRPAGHVDIPVATLEGGYTEAGYYYLNPAGTGVTFECHPDGGKTSANTSYPRTEQREYNQDGTTKAAFNLSNGTHVYEWELSCGEIWPNKKWTTSPQLHDASSDAVAFKFKPPAGTSVTGGDRTTLSYIVNFYDTDHPTPLVTGYNATLGDAAAKIKMRCEFSSGGVCKIFVNDVLKITSNATAGKGSGHYWKYGAYGQSAVSAGGNEPASARCKVTYYSHKTTHTPAI